MIEWSLDAFRACASVRSIVVAMPPGYGHRLGGERRDGDAGECELEVVDGGATRARSVANALAAVDTALVAIHDAARPLVTPELVEALASRLEAAPDAAGVIAATPVTDTVKRVSAGIIAETLDRSQLWAAQTPQLFRMGPLREVLVSAPNSEQATDEAMLVEQAGGTVLIHPCGPENLKVTTPLDLRVAELVLAERSAAQQ
jgi:2-C-methyl-D-erythritol 4-phosphate cytidylyltransferase